MINIIVGAIYSLIFIFLLSSLEFIARRNHIDREITRRVAHILSGFFGLFMGFVLQPGNFILFSLIFFLFIAFSYAFNFFSSIHFVKRKTYGELLFPLGVLTSYILSGGPTTIFFASVLILTISDPLAGSIGSSKSLSKKSIIGSFSFFISALICLLVVFKGEQILGLFVVVFFITLVEHYSHFGIDNILIPVTGSLLLRMIF